MNNEQTILELGFVHYPAWDYKDLGIKHYRLDREGVIFRAQVMSCNGPVYVELAVVVDEIKGLTGRWVDCVSNGSVARKIEREIKDRLSAKN